MRKEMLMGYLYNASEVKEIKRIPNFRSKITQVEGLFDGGINKKFKILTIWNYLLLFMLLLFCYVASGYAADVTLKWT
jgi:hypothetical protein